MRLSIIGCALVAFAGTALAEDAGALLRRVEQQAGGYQDAKLEWSMTILEPAGRKREVKLVEKRKGRKVLLRFLAPDDIKGMGLLAESPEKLYAVLPAFGNRVRRLGAQGAGNKLMGSEVSFLDFLAGPLSKLLKHS